MKSLAWIPFASARYVSARKRSRNTPSSLLSVLGIAVGVLALIVVLSVMNGFQLGFIESILEISSYHVRIETPPGKELDEAALDSLREDSRVRAVLPFLDLQTIAKGPRWNQSGALVRGIPADSSSLDPSLNEALKFEQGSLDLSSPRSIVVGAELAQNLGLLLGDQVSLLSLSSNALALSREAGDGLFTVTGIFRCGYYEYDMTWAFIRLDEARALAGEQTALTYGLKLQDRWRDQAFLRSLSLDEAYSAIPVSSWRDYNRAFFAALRMEKNLMFVLMALIFVVVALNIFQSQRRIVMERYEDIGLLKAVGASSLAIRLVFAFDGFLIGLGGMALGLVPALAISLNISRFFTIVETAINAVIGAANWLVSLFTHGDALSGDFSVFSPSVFYLKEIPSRVLPGEVLFISVFALLSATLAAWLAAGKAARLRPVEVLRYE